MSALGGLYNFDGAPVDAGLLAALGEGLSARGPDGGLEFISGPIGMAYRAFHTNEESRLEAQPLVTSRGHILCWDGRLDNREELIAQLREYLQGDRTDVAIVMAAYFRWGMDFLPKITGDFSLSLWDPDTKTLLLARDLIGTRMLYYHANARGIIWSTELSPLLDLAGIALEVDNEYLAGFFLRYPELSRTPYKNINSVMPNHVLIARSGQVKSQRFWKPDPNRQFRYESDREYEEHFLRLFKEAVRCRLRADGPVWADLSGGLDSSSIVCIADQLIKNGEAQASSLETVSGVYKNASTSDESRFIACVEQNVGKESHKLSEIECPQLSPFADELSLVMPNPIHGYARYYGRVGELMRQGGARVILSGIGGDELLYSNEDPSPELADALARLKIAKLHRSTLTWSYRLKRPYLSLLWNDAIKYVLPLSAQNRLYAKKSLEIPEWLDVRFADYLRERKNCYGISVPFDMRLPSGRDYCMNFSSVINDIAAGYYRERVKVDYVYPCLHRPLVEFLIAIPPEQKVRPGESRSLMRRAFKGILPEQIRNRRGKGSAHESVIRALAQQRARLMRMFARSLAAEQGYINSDALIAALERTRHGHLTAFVFMTKVVSLELWLRSLELRVSQKTLDTGDMLRFAAAQSEAGASSGN